MIVRVSVYWLKTVEFGVSKGNNDRKGFWDRIMVRKRRGEQMCLGVD